MDWTLTGFGSYILVIIALHIGDMTMTRSHNDDKTSWLMMMTKPGQVVPRTRHWRNLKIHVSPVTIVLEHVTVRTHVTYDTACVHYLSLITYNTKHFFSIQS